MGAESFEHKATENSQLNERLESTIRKLLNSPLPPPPPPSPAGIMEVYKDAGNGHGDTGPVLDHGSLIRRLQDTSL